MACYADSYFTCQKKSFNAASSFSFQIKRYHKNETLLNGVYSRTNVPRNIKDGEYVINLAKYDKSHHIELFAMLKIKNDATYFADVFGVENIPKGIIGYKNGIKKLDKKIG